MNHDTIKVEPKAISDLEYYAAKEAAARHVGELPDPLWPGHVLEEVRATEPDCAAYRADKPPRVPRNTEPCPLWVAGLIAVGVGGGALLGAAALGWVVYQVVIWIGGVL